MTAAGPQKSLRAFSTALLPLMAVAVFINYVDRGNLATAGPLIKDELVLSASQFGLVASAFFWSYTPCQLLAGWLAERFNPYRTLAVGVAVWSLATAVTGLAAGFVSLLVLRVLLGVGESVIIPCSSKVIAENLPHHRMGTANGVLLIGTALGPAFGTFFGALIMARLGWRPGFLIFGLGSLLWLAPWMLASGAAFRQAPQTARSPRPALMDIVRRPEAWAAAGGHFALNYSFYFVVNWLPTYLVKVQGLTIAQMGVRGGLIYLTYAASAVVFGWLSDRLIAAGLSVTLVRKAWVGAGAALVAVGLAACAVGGPALANIGLFTAAAAFGFGGSALLCIAQTLAGSRAAGTWVGFQQAVGNSAGIIAPFLTGVLIDRTGGFAWSFAVAAAVAVFGGLSVFGGVRKVVPVDWTAPGATRLKPS